MFSSDGKIVVVAPSSAPILAIEALSGMPSSLTPGPQYSMIFPTPPLTEYLLNISRITSLAETHGLSLPVNFTPNIFGIFK